MPIYCMYFKLIQMVLLRQEGTCVWIKKYWVQCIFVQRVSLMYREDFLWKYEVVLEQRINKSFDIVDFFSISKAYLLDSGHHSMLYRFLHSHYTLDVFLFLCTVHSTAKDQLQQTSQLALIIPLTWNTQKQKLQIISLVKVVFQIN